MEYQKQIKINPNSPVLSEYFSLEELKQLRTQHRIFIQTIFEWIVDEEIGLDCAGFDDKAENHFFIEVDKGSIEGITQFYYIDLVDDVSIPMSLTQMIELMQGGMCNGIKLYD
jgi:hypothetical protein